LKQERGYCECYCGHSGERAGDGGDHDQTQLQARQMSHNGGRHYSEILQIHSDGVHGFIDLCGGIMGLFPSDSF
jgi:hypothetical protein